MLQHALAQYHALYRPTDFSRAFLDPQNLQRVLEMINAEVRPRIGSSVEPDPAFVNELHRFVLELDSCGRVPPGLEEANAGFASRILKPFLAEAFMEKRYRQEFETAYRDDRELFYQRQYQHDPVERPQESTQRHYATITSD